MSLDELFSKAATIVYNIKSVKTLLEETFKDQSHDFEDRWNAYELWYQLGGETTHSCWYGFDNLLPGHTDIIGYDCPLPAERYQTVDLYEFVESPDGLKSMIAHSQEIKEIKDKVSELRKDLDYLLKEEYSVYELEYTRGYEAIWEEYEHLIRPFKEALMTAGISHCYWDW